MSRMLMISSDCHAGPPIEVYGDYLDPKYRRDFDEYLEARVALRAMNVRRLFAKSHTDTYDEADAVQDGGRAGLWDSDRRVRELEADGVVAEVLFPDGTENNEVPFGPFGGLRDHPAELRLAGAKAYNRWLADVCSLEPARRAGVALVPLHDIDAAVAEIRWAKEAGLRGGVGLHPGDPALPLYHDARYEPIWATCAELGMPVNFHTGPGKPDYGTGDAARMLIVTEGTLFFAHRSLWFLIWAGVFERYPTLRYVLTENRAGWLPFTLEWLDDLYTGSMFRDVQEWLPHKPSEYWYRNCYVGASFFHAGEAAIRDTVGVDNILWGSDYPHVEGTWPNSQDALRSALAEVPEHDARRIVGGTAAAVYGFDVDVLAPIAERVGPEAADLVGVRPV